MRSGAGGRLPGSAGGNGAPFVRFVLAVVIASVFPDKIGFVPAINSVDSVVNRGVKNGESARGYRRRRPASANGIERSGVPLDDYVTIGRSIREGTSNALLPVDREFAADL